MSDEKEDDQKKAMHALNRAFMLGAEMEKMHRVLFERVVGSMLHDRTQLRLDSTVGSVGSMLHDRAQLRLDSTVDSVTTVVEHYYKEYYSRKENFVLLAGSFFPAPK